MNWAEWAADLAFLVMPPLSCAWAWWLWTRKSADMVPPWRRVATMIGLTAFTLSIALGAFAFAYWRHAPASSLTPPQATRVTTLVGFAMTVFGIPFCLMAKSWNRIALVLCSLGLLGFYFGMFVAL
jgi:hypothetical protein